MAQERIKYLDGLRGLAAMLIILHHYALAFLPGRRRPAKWLYRLRRLLEIDHPLVQMHERSNHWLALHSQRKFENRIR